MAENIKGLLADRRARHRENLVRAGRIGRTQPITLGGMLSDVAMMPNPIGDAAEVASFAGGLLSDPAQRARLRQNPFSVERTGQAPGVDVFGQMTGGNLLHVAPSDVQLRGLLALAPFWHGSPHRFGRVGERPFRMSKVGTGEGAQAFGHGLYFAQKRGVAESYRGRGITLNEAGMQRLNEFSSSSADALADDWRRWDLHDGSYWWETIEDMAAREGRDIEDVMLNAGESQRLVDKWIRENPSSARAERTVYVDSAKEQYLPGGDKYEAFSEQLLGKPEFQSAGSLFEVDIPDEAVEQMLDWDKPLSEQLGVIGELKLPADETLTGRSMSEANLIFDNAIRQAKAGDAGITGGDLYGLMARAVGQERASQLLNGAGIPGIKYLDAFSRGARTGTKNVVVFDEALPKVTRIE